MDQGHQNMDECISSIEVIMQSFKAQFIQNPRKLNNKGFAQKMCQYFLLSIMLKLSIC